MIRRARPDRNVGSLEGIGVLLTMAEHLTNLLSSETVCSRALDEAFSCSLAERLGAVGLETGNEQLIEHSLA